MDESEFLALLDNEYQKRYKEDRSQVIKKKNEEFNQKEDFFTKRYKKGIEDDQVHRAIINACVSPFHEKGSLKHTGYRFIHASPLFELGIQNFDFLLYRKHKENNLLIVGEAKGSVSDPSKIINEAIERKKNFKDNIDNIKKNYLHLDIDADIIIDYVIAVPSHLSPEILNAVIDKGGGFIVWHTPPAGKQRLFIAFPSEGINSDLKKTMIHRDNQLNREIPDTMTNHKAFNIFPQVHMMSGLRMLITASSPGDTGLTVKEETLKEDLENEMFYLNDEHLEHKVREIISKAVEIDFLTPVDPQGCYRIKATGMKASTLERKLEDKWIKYKLANKYKQIELEAIAKLQQKIIKEQKKQPKLTDF